MEPIIQAVLITAASSTAGPLFLAWFQDKQRRRAQATAERRWNQKRAEDNQRQDAIRERAEEVALQAAKAAQLLLNSQQNNISRTDEVARAAAATAEDQRNQLTQIHTLVNSDKTDALQAELNQTRITLVLLRRFVALDDAVGRVSTTDDLAAIKLAEANINRLETTLADRGVQLQQVEIQVQEAKEAKEAKVAKAE